MQNSQIPASNCHRNLPAKAYMDMCMCMCALHASAHGVSHGLWLLSFPLLLWLLLILLSAVGTHYTGWQVARRCYTATAAAAIAAAAVAKSSRRNNSTTQNSNMTQTYASWGSQMANRART